VATFRTFDSEEVLQFVTFRLADSLPKEALDRIKLSSHPESLRDELLDRGWGACWLRLLRIAQMVEDAFLKFDGDRIASALGPSCPTTCTS
jgi:putative transposase